MTTSPEGGWNSAILLPARSMGKYSCHSAEGREATKSVMRVVACMSVRVRVLVGGGGGGSREGGAITQVWIMSKR